MKQYSWLSLFPQDKELVIIIYPNQQHRQGTRMTQSQSFDLNQASDFVPHLVCDFMEKLEGWTSFTWMDSQVVWVLLVGWSGGDMGHKDWGAPLGQLNYTEPLLTVVESSLTRDWLPNHGSGVKLGLGAGIVSKVQADQMITKKQGQMWRGGARNKLGRR